MVSSCKWKIILYIIIYNMFENMQTLDHAWREILFHNNYWKSQCMGGITYILHRPSSGLCWPQGIHYHSKWTITTWTIIALSLIQPLNVVVVTVTTRNSLTIIAIRYIVSIFIVPPFFHDYSIYYIASLYLYTALPLAKYYTYKS